MMQALSGLTPENTILAALVAARMTGFVLAMPSALALVSWRIRLALVVTTTAILLPNLPSIAVASVHTPVQLAVDTLIGVGRELVLGMIIGGVVQLLISGVQLAGELITNVAGLPIDHAHVSGESMPALSRLIGLLVTAVLFAAGGHRYLMAALIESLKGVAPGGSSLDQSLIGLVVEQLTTGMAAGLRVAAPVLAATLMAQLLVGMVSRTIPQINVLAVGLNLNVLVVLVVTAITIGTVGLVFERELASATAHLYSMW